jgi:ATP-dependent DNA helicase RecQ
VPKVTEEGWKVLRKQREFQMIRSAPNQSRNRKVTKGSVEQYSEGLFERLRAIRADIARSGNVPPYVVFSDRSLHEMSAYFPTTTDEFLLISGVGQHKLESYGKAFLKAIFQYAAEHPEEYADRQMPSAPLVDTPAQKPPSSEQETLRLFHEGKSLKEICSLRSLKRSTIISHIDSLVNAGYEVPFKSGISPARLEQIAEWFRQAKTWNLAPVVELSKGKLDYEEARLARVVLKQQKRSR